MDKTVWTKTF